MKRIPVSERFMWSSFEHWQREDNNLSNTVLYIINDIEASLRQPWEGWFEFHNELIVIEILESDTPASECFSEDIWYE